MADVAPDGTIYMAPVPPGYTRNSGLSLKPALIASGTVLTILALISVLMRIFTRTIVIRNGLYFDDLLVCIAMTMSIIMYGVNFPMQDTGIGLHLWDVTFDMYSPGLGKWTIITTCFYALGITFSKLSILAFYLRLSPVKWFRIGVWILFGLVSAYSVSYIFAIIFRCSPVEAGWDLTVQALPTTKCSDTLSIMMVLSIANICMDLITLLLPIPIVIPLQMRMAQKISVFMLFTTGAFVCAVAIRRTIQMQAVVGTPTDYTWDIVEQFHWSYLEVDLGIICASVPALKPLFKRYLAPLFSSTLGRSSRDAVSGASNPYNTVIKRNAQRREAQGYELGSRDDKFGKNPSPDEDETRLWTKENQESFQDNNTTVITSKARDTSSDSGSDILTQGQTSTANTLRGAPRGINVKTETSIQYGSRK
ncbi:hypothetical protein F5B20DRAFT_280804 [Whalleya microplaca]|nr:hypothetical protein F5B20DRAFT_280804 [Whalleya microplaca]